LVLEPERYELRESARYHFTPTRREFLQATATGLLLLVTAEEAEGQRGGEEAALEARLHIGKDGSVTVLTGKIEEGQGARTELAMAAAEEMGLQVADIRVVTADTDKTPNDGTTAGSRSTPANVPQVRRAGAAMRALLMAEAARQWGADAATLQVEGGAVTGAGGRRFGYADLAQSPELAKAVKSPAPRDVKLTPPAGWDVFGKAQAPSNAREIVTGAHEYPSDIRREGMLYGAVLRPPSYGATLEGLDLSAGKAGGTVAVRDGEFAGCAASTSYAARKAVEAMAATAKWKTADHPSSDVLFEHLKKTARPPRQPSRGTGDVERALAESAKKWSASYQAAYVQHAPMEPRAAVAEWNEGKLTVWTGTSNPFSVRQALAEAFRIPQDRVRVIVPDFGGGFGGKHTGEAAIEAARLAKEAGKPVKLRWTRAEEFMWAYSRPAALIEVEAGLDAQGKLVAWQFTNYNSGTAAIESPYRIPNARTQFLQSDTPLRQGSYRALASTVNNFARESAMDELAAAAGADPLEFRLAHLDNQRIKDVLTAATGKFGWAERWKSPRKGTGLGLACGTEKNSVVAACVEVSVDERTGEPKLLEICEAFECGAVLNPLGLRSQVEGCILMGLGAVLREELLFEGGKLKNGRFSAYKVPRFRDVPKMEVVFLDRKDQEPVGAGETPIIAVAPAMANAVFRLSGQRVRSLPLRVPVKKT
jgi:isoquinoline 1-oxidoreductase